MSTEPEWFYVEGEERRGPFDFAAMRQLFNAGILKPDSQVARNDDSEWSPAERHFGEMAAQAPPVPIVETAIPAPTKTFNTRLRALLGDWRVLPLAALLIVAVFVGQLFLCAYLFNWGNPDPTSREFAWSRVATALLKLAGLTMLPALAGCWLQRFRAQLKASKRKPPVWTTVTLTFYWLAVVMLCWGISWHPQESSSMRRLTGLYIDGAGGGFPLLLSIVGCIAVVAASTIMSERTRRQFATITKGGEALPIFPLIARGWAAIATILILTALVASASVAAMKWPVRKNTDGRTATQFVRAIEAFQEKQGGKLAKEWTKLPPPQEPWEPFVPLVGYGTQTSQGDVEGTTDGLLLKLLNQEVEEGTVLGPRGNPPAEIRDMWGRLFHVVLDANGDGEVKVGGKTYAAKAAVWSCGWNGREDSGGWDDVMRLLK